MLHARRRSRNDSQAVRAAAAPSEFPLASPTPARRKPQTLPLAKKASLELDETDTLYSIRLHSF
jgi:hypothetical protein